jgi:multidrug efflux pump subunit AcrA (membrane-fusion protein)
MKFLKKYRKKIILGLAIALILFWGFHQIQAQKYKNPQVFNPKKDTVVTPKTKDINYSITLSGSIDAKDKAEVRFQTPGRLIWVGVKEGDRVKKWQSLASLDRQELRKQLEISLNNYKTQLSQFDDTQDKYKTEKDNLTLTDEMKRILNRSQYSLNNSVISYELNDLAIKYATIWSPINGIVTSVEPANP